MSEGAAEGPAAQIVWPEDALWPQGGYANTIRINHTPWDFTIYFGHVTLPPVDLRAQAGASVELVATPAAQVTLSPVAAAQLAAILQTQIAAYTEHYGPVGGAPEQGIV
jgi:hypothetical protein